MKKALLICILATICLFYIPTSAQKVKEPTSGPPEWSQSYVPFRIVGNVYYVGTYDLACYLIVTPQGNILINTGLAASAQTIKENIETLGFKFNDVKILLTTQAHYDHVGAMSAIKKQTGAMMMVNEKDAGVLTDGGSSDYELGKNGSTYEPVKVDRLLKNGDKITYGGMDITMLHHPGHTKGSSSFLFDVREEDKKYNVLIVNMPSIVTDRKLSAIPLYPDIAKDYAYTFASMKKLSFDIWLSSHASQFGLHSKHKPGAVYSPTAFIDRPGYDKEVSELEAAFRKKMEER
ncbi:subclass B3 metallo-beta-lactamase BJP-1 [soil metagenome]